jgi:hypothetical protein
MDAICELRLEGIGGLPLDETGRTCGFCTGVGCGFGGSG